MTQKKRIGVLFGGRSSEHEVSLASAASIMQSLNTEKYDIIPILITPDGTWLWGKDPRNLASNPTAPVVALPADPHTQTMISMQAGVSLPENGKLDVLFPVLHGPNGEDGTIQGLFELANIPYVGCGVLASAVGMDKVIMKQLFQAANLPIVEFLSYRRYEWHRDAQKIVEDVENRLSYPCFIKPANLGSSVGVGKAQNRAQLIEKIENAFRYDRKIVIERGVDCREFSCAILGNEEPQASVVGEILPGNDFSDYNDKYVNHEIKFVIPSQLSEETSNMLRQQALDIYRLLDLNGVSRVDFFFDKANEKFYINEVNTMPGFTSMSLYPQLWQASGLNYPELLDNMIHFALERHEQRQQLRTER